jgi:S1-C subfamily serine protease
MRLSPSVCTLAVVVLLHLPAALAAQTTAPTPGAPRPPGCRGVTSTTNTVSLSPEWVFPSYAVIESVQPGSPAALAGFRPWDVVVMQDGRDLIANPPTQPALAGDTVVFTVRRNDVEIPLTVVMGRWDPPQEAPGVTRICRPVGASAP